MFINVLKKNRVVPVIVIENGAVAAPLAETIADAGLTCLEITLRTGAAIEAIKVMAQHPGVMLGAGTVLTLDQAKAATDSGARFIVSPGMSVKIVNWCQDRKIPVIPGCATPTEIQQAHEAGIDLVKFFPAEHLGGVKMLSALASVFRGMQFMPTGGINAQNISHYLAMKQVVACGGSWMVKTEWIRKRQFDRIHQEIRTMIAKMND